jgi:opacity protein-like surface antigen
MSRVRALFVGVIGALAFVASAHAADPAGSWRRPPTPPPESEPEPETPTPQYKELLSGWYLRGDAGYRWNGGGPSAANIKSERYSSSFDGSVGFGYKYRWFRADVIYDRAGPSRVRATTTVATGQPQYSAKIDAQTVLVNGYVDFGTWGGFTPYVGAGVGAARLKSVNYTDTTDQPPADPNVMGQGTHQNFAWAAMAGVAYQVAPSWLIDVGYRYISLGNVPSSGGAGTQTNAVVFKGQHTNEARIGVRYLFD